MKILLPFLPPSTNNAYITIRGGGRRLSDEGRAFKTSVTDHILRAHMKELQDIEKNIAYRVEVCLYFSSLINTTWPKEAKSRYKRIDTDNRVKLLLDAVSAALGVDDSTFFRILIEKKEGTPERSEVLLVPL